MEERGTGKCGFSDSLFLKGNSSAVANVEYTSASNDCRLSAWLLVLMVLEANLSSIITYKGIYGL